MMNQSCNNPMKIANHPIFLYSSEIVELCQPLLKLNISYFAHVHIDQQGSFAAISNNPAFANHYLTHQYYNADIHMAANNQFGNYVIWDAIERIGHSLKMHSEAAEFGVRHTFTIMETDSTGSHFYHFATHLASSAINQIYLTNLDLLNLFIDYFKDNIQQSKSLIKAYDIKFMLATEGAGYMFRDGDTLSVPRFEFMNDLDLKYYHKNLSERQIECLYHLVHGKTQKQIAAMLNLAPKTIEHYLETIKHKFSCYSRSELVATALKIPAIKEKLF
jgi:DNA-binding CsgD family transcriptional regulator